MNEACPELAPLLAARPLGVLEDDEVAKLDAHTKECARCASFAKELETALATAAPPARPAPAATWDKIAQRIEQDRTERLAGTEVIGLPVKVSLSCTFCHEGLSSREAAYCASCLAPHHGDCFQEHGRCSAPGCGETRTVAPRAAPPRRSGRIVRLAWIVVGSAVAATAAVAAVRWRDLRAYDAALAIQLAQEKRHHAALERELRIENDKLRTEIALIKARAALASNSKRYDEAITLLTKAIELDPRMAETWNDRGRIRCLTGDLHGAIADAGRAIELDPGIAVAWNLRGSARLSIGEANLAVADCTRAIEIDPKLVQGWGSRGEARALLGDRDGAIEDFETALRLTHDPELRSHLVSLERGLTSTSGEPLKVLLVEGRSRRDFQFMTRFLEKDPGVLLHTWLASAEKGYEQEHSSPDGRDDDASNRFPEYFAPLRALPVSVQDLCRYDVIVVGDVNVGELGPHFAENLAGYAETHGGGLVFLGGEADALHSLRGTPLEAVLPFVPVLQAPQGGTFTEQLQFRLTKDGVESPITRLKQDPARNAQVWDKLARPFWVAPVQSVRPEATVLATTAIDNRPLLVAGSVGRAHVFVALTDEMWRWRAGVGDEYTGVLWKNILAWARKVDLHGKPGYLGAHLVDNDAIVKIVQVFPGSPAEKAGLKPGDEILAIGTLAVPSLEVFRDELARHGPNTAVTISGRRLTKDEMTAFSAEVFLGVPPKEK